MKKIMNALLTSFTVFFIIFAFTGCNSSIDIIKDPESPSITDTETEENPPQDTEVTTPSANDVPIDIIKEPESPIISNTETEENPPQDIEVTMPSACDVPSSYPSVDDFIMAEKMPAFFIPEKLPETAQLLDIGFMGSYVHIGYGLNDVDYWLYRYTEYASSARYLFGYHFEGGCEKLSEDFNFKDSMEGYGYIPFDDSGNYYYDDIPFNREDKKDDIIARTLYWEQDNYLFNIALPIKYFNDENVLQYAKAVKYIADYSPDAVVKYEQRKKQEAEAWAKSMEELSKNTTEIIPEQSPEGAQNPVTEEPVVVVAEPVVEEPIYKEVKFNTLEELKSYTKNAFYLPENLPESATVREITYCEGNYLNIVYAFDNTEYLNPSNSVKFNWDYRTTAAETFKERVKYWPPYDNNGKYYQDEMHILRNEPISRTIYWQENNMTFKITLPINYFTQETQWDKVTLTNNE